MVIVPPEHVSGLNPKRKYMDISAVIILPLPNSHFLF